MYLTLGLITCVLVWLVVLLDLGQYGLAHAKNFIEDKSRPCRMYLDPDAYDYNPPRSDVATAIVWIFLGALIGPLFGLIWPVTWTLVMIAGILFSLRAEKRKEKA